MGTIENYEELSSYLSISSIGVSWREWQVHRRRQGAIVIILLCSPSHILKVNEMVHTRKGDEPRTYPSSSSKDTIADQGL
jgi:hypothetical protein